MAKLKEKTGKKEAGLCCETKVSETPEGVRIEIDAKGEGVKKQLEEFRKGNFSGCGCCSSCFTPTTTKAASVAAPSKKAKK